MAGGFGRTSQALAVREASPEPHKGHGYGLDSFLAQQQDRIRHQLEQSERRVLDARRRGQERAELGDLEMEIRGTVGSDASPNGSLVLLKQIGVR